MLSQSRPEARSAKVSLAGGPLLGGKALASTLAAGAGPSILFLDQSCTPIPPAVFSGTEVDALEWLAASWLTRLEWLPPTRERAVIPVDRFPARPP
jgi:hypothetical protein